MYFWLLNIPKIRMDVVFLLIAGLLSMLLSYWMFDFKYVSRWNANLVFATKLSITLCCILSVEKLEFYCIFYEMYLVNVYSPMKFWKMLNCSVEQAEDFDFYVDVFQFYADLTEILLTHQSKVKDFVFARNTEKEDLLK